MSKRTLWLVAPASALMVTLSGCGGGGGGGGVSTIPSPSPPPPPAPAPPPPPPPPTDPVSIFANPSVGEFASMGTSALGSDTVNLNTPLGAISAADGDQLRIRYMADGSYQVEFPGGPVRGFTWHPLSLYGQGTAPTVLTDETRDLILSLSGSKDHGYQYSELGSWVWIGNDFDNLDMIGADAFGTLTPNGAVPIAGSASYSGIIAGKSDVIASDSFDGPNRANVSGTVDLNFNFAAGSLAGAMTVNLSDFSGDSLPLGSFNFKDTVYSTGSTSYSGKFDSTAAGDNFFLGKFTGPNAEETIGAWALPFVLNTGNATITADHQAHQAFGAWIAKKP